MFFKRRYLSPTADAAGAPAGQQPPAAPTGETPNSGTGAGNAQNPPATPPTPETITFRTPAELQAYIDNALKERLEREKKKTDKATAEAREQAEAEAAKKNGEWQKLAETRETKIKEQATQIETLTQVQEKAERYEKALKAHLDTQRAGLPAHVTLLLDKLDPAEQLEYIAANRAALLPAQPPVTPPGGPGNGKPPAGVPPTPPASAGGMSDDERRKVAYKPKL